MPITIHHAESTLGQGPKRAYIKSYGCQMNVYDGLKLAELLHPLGYGMVNDPTDADLIVLNTCHIREKADDKLFSDVGRLHKKVAPRAIIAVGGCTGQALGATLMQQAPSVQIVFGPQSLHRLPALLEEVTSGRQKRAVDVELAELEKFREKFDVPQLPGQAPMQQARQQGAAQLGNPSAFVTIQEGCDKFCTYCVVPYTRGPEISRPAADIVQEVAHLAAHGAREITLLGQNVNAYEHTLGDGHGERVTDFAGLLAQCAEIEGVARLRFTTSHPNNTTPELIAAFAENPKLMPYFHLPVQAGSNRILRAMNRNHTVESYLSTIQAVRAAVPGIAISGDFIVGFPGETEEDFQATLTVAHAVGYVGAYSFAFSPRPGTPAAELPDHVPELVKKERLAALQAVLDASTAAFAATFVGQTVEVLVEGPGGQRGQLRGRSPHNLPVNFTVIDPAADLPALVGRLVTVQVARSTPKALVGVMVTA